MPDLGLQDQFAQETIVTRDGDDEILWDVDVSWEDEERLVACVEWEYYTEAGETKATMRVDTLTVVKLGLKCVTGWQGVTQDGKPLRYPVGAPLEDQGELYAQLPKPHRAQFAAAFAHYGMERAFPARYLKDGSPQDTETLVETSPTTSQSEEIPPG